MIEFNNLEKTPALSLHNSHYYCDYIELVALCDADDIVSTQDIYTRFHNDGKISRIGTDESSETNEDWNSRIANWFDNLTIRASCYGDDYPFNIESNTIKLKENINQKGELYIGLLLCSLLSYFKNNSLFTSVFENFSLLATKSYLSESSMVHRFGVSTLGNSRYSGSLKNKITALADDIGLRIVCDDRVFRERDNGDGGVDIVAWLPFLNDSNLSRRQLFLGQSAAGKNWIDKQGSVARIRNYINLPDNTQNVLYIPYDMRDSERFFEEEGSITSSIVFDRFRIFNLVEPQKIWDSDRGEEFRSAIIAAIKYEEDIV